MTAWNLHFKASQLIGRGDFSAASTVYEELAAADPSDSFAILMLAQCYEQQGRLADALRFAEEGTRQLPQSLDALQVAVRLAVANEEHEKATAYIQTALALPEVRTEMPREFMPGWARRFLAGLFRLPFIRRHVRHDALDELAPGKRAMDLQDWKRWALEYLAWRGGQPSGSLGSAVH